MKTPFSLIVLCCSIVISAAAQRASDAHQWAPLLQQLADRVEIDTAAVRSRDGSHEVWLRWTTVTAGRISVYSIERREIDCAGGRTRVLAEEQITEQAPTPGPPEHRPSERANLGRATAPTRGRQAEWYQPSAGSLLALTATAVCQLVRQAGA